MDFKDIDNNDTSGSYYNAGWFIKNIIITLISSIPAFIWASYRGDNASFGVAIILIPVLFAIVFLGDVLRKIAMPKAVISEGGAWEMIKKKIYWSIGPQFSAVFFAYIVIFITGSILSRRDNVLLTRPVPETVQENHATPEPENEY